MKKRSLFWTILVFTIILAQSCNLPTSVRINADNLELGVRFRAGTDFSSLFLDILEEAFSGEDAQNVRIFDMVSLWPAMTFLAAFELEDMLPSLSGYFDDFVGQDIGSDIAPIEIKIELPDALEWTRSVTIPLPGNLTNLPPGLLPGTYVVEFPTFPQEIADVIQDALYDWDTPVGFLHGSIGSGSFNITARLEGSNIPIKISGSIATSQNAIPPLGNGGREFGGLSIDKPWNFSPDAPHEWELSPGDPEGNLINGNPIIVHPALSSLAVELSPLDLVGVTHVIIDMELNVESFGNIRWDPSDNELFSIDPIQVDFDEMVDDQDLFSYIHKIVFEYIKLSLDFDFGDFSEAIDGKIALAITSERLELYAMQVNLSGTTIFNTGHLEMDFYNDGFGVEIKIEPVPLNGEYFELGWIDLGKNYPYNNYLNVIAHVGVDFEWESATIGVGLLEADTGFIDPDIFSGNLFPDPINLGDTLGDFMSGFMFAEDSIDIRLFLDGAGHIIDALGPVLTLRAVFDEGASTVALLDEEVLTLNAAVPSLPDNNIWHGSLPADDFNLDLEKFLNEFNKGLPEYLNFFYEVSLGGENGTITITRDLFDDSNNDGINAMIMMKLALDFDVQYGAYLSLPLFDDNDYDIFGRDAVEDPLFGSDEIDITMLMLRLDFDESIFRGAVLHLDADGRLFPEGLRLNDGINGNLEIRITAADFDIINRYLIPPDVRIVYPQAKRLAIHRNLMPTRIAIAVSGSYTLDL